MLATITTLPLPSVVKMAVACSLCSVRNWLAPTGINARGAPSTGRTYIAPFLMVTNSPPSK
jgi:hypothetical protein